MSIQIKKEVHNNAYKVHDKVGEVMSLYLKGIKMKKTNDQIAQELFNVRNTNLDYSSKNQVSYQVTLNANIPHNYPFLSQMTLKAFADVVYDKRDFGRRTKTPTKFAEKKW